MTSKNSLFNRFLLFEFWDLTLFCGNLKKINILIFRFIASFSNSERLAGLRDPVVDSIFLQYECFISNKMMALLFLRERGWDGGQDFQNRKVYVSRRKGIVCYWKVEVILRCVVPLSLLGRPKRISISHQRGTCPICYFS